MNNASTRAAKKAQRKGKRAATQELLDELGVDSIDEVRSIVEGTGTPAPAGTPPADPTTPPASDSDLAAQRQALEAERRQFAAEKATAAKNAIKNDAILKLKIAGVGTVADDADDAARRKAANLLKRAVRLIDFDEIADSDDIDDAIDDLRDDLPHLFADPAGTGQARGSGRSGVPGTAGTTPPPNPQPVATGLDRGRQAAKNKAAGSGGPSPMERLTKK